MEGLGKDCPSSDDAPSSSTTSKESAVPDVIITHRLRDREMLRKRKAQALEKDSAEWVLRVNKNKPQKKGRQTKRGRGCQLEVKATLEPESTTGPEPELCKKIEQGCSEPPLPEPVRQEQLPMLTIQNPVSGVQPAAVGGEPAARSLDPAGEEEVVKPAAAEILEVFNTPLENDRQEN